MVGPAAHLAAVGSRPVLSFPALVSPPPDSEGPHWTRDARSLSSLFNSAGVAPPGASFSARVWATGFWVLPPAPVAEQRQLAAEAPERGLS